MTGSFPLALGAALLFGFSFLVERMFLRYRFDAYFTLGLGVGEQLVPIPVAPKGSGQTKMVAWEVVHDNLVRFWALPGRRGAPLGLRGSIALLARRHDVALVVRWAPPFSPLAAALWLVSLGVVRHEWIAIPIGVALFGLILYAYHQAAVRAVAELRWAFVRQTPEPTEED